MLDLSSEGGLDLLENLVILDQRPPAQCALAVFLLILFLYYEPNK
jgi:hypothetical protein